MVVTLPPALDAPGRAAALEMLCARHGVALLDLFGSAGTDEFDPAHSDIDLLVQFAPDSPTRSAFDFLALRDALAEVFHRPVDLVEGPVARLGNPHFRRSVEATRRRLLAV